MINIEALKHDFHSKDNILIAVSGGPDSMALLDTLYSLKEKIPFSISVAHVNYHLRKESDREAHGVKEYCHERNIPFYQMDADPRTLDQSGKSVEEWARDIRYEFFDTLMEAYGFNKLLTAHHSGDQVETILMRLFRGSGPNGMTGINQERINGSYKILRPFLSENKVDLRQYCDENKIEYFIDSSNDESHFSRNFIRNEIIPSIENRFPNFKKHVLEFAEILSEENQVIQDIVDSFSKAFVRKTEWGVEFKPVLFEDSQLAFKEQGLKYLSEKSRRFILSELIRNSIKEIAQLKDISKEHIRRILEFYTAGASGEIELPNRIIAIKSGTTFLIARRDLLPKAFGDYIINVKINQLGNKSFLFPKEKKRLTLRNGKARDFSKHFKSPDKVLLKSEQLNMKTLHFRGRQSNDEVFLSGMSGRKKLSRYMIDKKIPKFLRDSLPVLADGNTVIWIPGYYLHRDYSVHSPEDNVIELVYQDL